MDYGVPANSDEIIGIPQGSNTIRRGDFVYWASGNGKAGAVGTDSQTAATLDAAGIGIAVDDTTEVNRYGSSAVGSTIRVATRGLFWVAKNDNAVATLGQYANPTSLATASAPAKWTATSTATNAAARIIDAKAGWMLVQLI